MRSQDSFAKKQEKIDNVTQKFNRTMEDMRGSTGVASSGVDNLAGRITKLVSVAYLAKKAIDGMFSAIKLGDTQKSQLNTFQGLLNSDSAGTAMYNYVSAYARDKSVLGRENIAKGMTNFLPLTRNINEVERLMNMMERLYAKDPTQGAEGAVFALKEAIGGEVLSLRNRFGISGVSGEELRAADLSGKLDILDSALNKFGASQEVVDRNFNNLSAQANKFGQELKAAIGEAAQPVVATLAETMIRLNAELQAGKYQPFINMIVNGMSMIGNGIAWVSENTDILIPIIFGAAGAFIAIKASMLAAAAAATIFHTSINPIFGILTALGGAAVGVGLGIHLTGDVDKEFQDMKESFEQTRANADMALNGLGPLDVEVANSDPIKVSGNVEIEQENMRYLLDIAGKKFFASFSTATLAPQVNIFGQTIEKTADADEVTERLVEGLETAIEAMPKGDH
jgi:murein DD-endopeptidase MepM/ murein hydrolase activator NlpD